MKFLKTAGLVAATLAVGAGIGFSAEGDKPKKGEHPGQGPVAMQMKRIETVLGKPLTDEQKTAIGDAFKTYQETVAKSLGLTLDEWIAKQKEFAKNNPGGRPAPK